MSVWYTRGHDMMLYAIVEFECVYGLIAMFIVVVVIIVDMCRCTCWHVPRPYDTCLCPRYEIFDYHCNLSQEQCETIIKEGDNQQYIIGQYT